MKFTVRNLGDGAVRWPVPIEDAKATFDRFEAEKKMWTFGPPGVIALFCESQVGPPRRVVGWPEQGPVVQVGDQTFFA